jgi:hypothetical protein
MPGNKCDVATRVILAALAGFDYRVSFPVAGREGRNCPDAFRKEHNSQIQQLVSAKLTYHGNTHFSADPQSIFHNLDGKLPQQQPHAAKLMRTFICQQTL